jgi:hypothetical protein
MQQCSTDGGAIMGGILSSISEWLSDGLYALSIGVCLAIALGVKFFWHRLLSEGERDREEAAANTLREYRTAQMAKVLHLYEKTRGRPPQHKDELVEWIQSAGGRAAISLHLDKSGEIIP